MKTLYVLNVGSTYDELNFKFGDFDQWAKDKILGVPTQSLHVKLDKFPKIQKCLGVVVMGSHAMVSDEEGWMKKTSDFLKECMLHEVPILGICFGHQLLAYALGGKVKNNPNGLEMGTVKINLTPKGETDKLFLGVDKTFDGFSSHFQSVVEFPKSLEILACNSHDKIHAFKYGKNAYGVQFHPEFTKEIMRFYAKKNQENLGDDFEKIYGKIKSCPMSEKVLTNFIDIVSL